MLATSGVYAKNILISVDNRSDDTISLKKSDGNTLMLFAHQEIENVSFKADEVVTNYINGKKKCTWKLKTEKNSKIIGIYYTEEGDSPCMIIVN